MFNFISYSLYVVNQLSKKFEHKYDYDYMKYVKEKIKELVKEWDIKYGGTGKEGLDKFIKKYTE